MKGILVLIATTVLLIISLACTDPTEAMTNEEIEFGIVELYVADIVKSDTADAIYVDPIQWGALTHENKKFVVYLFALRKMNSAALTSHILVYNNDTKEQVAMFYFNDYQEED